LYNYTHKKQGKMGDLLSHPKKITKYYFTVLISIVITYHLFSFNTGFILFIIHSLYSFATCGI
jgi:hypothetical protein